MKIVFQEHKGRCPVSDALDAIYLTHGESYMARVFDKLEHCQRLSFEGIRQQGFLYRDKKHRGLLIIRLRLSPPLFIMGHRVGEIFVATHAYTGARKSQAHAKEALKALKIEK